MVGKGLAVAALLPVLCVAQRSDLTLWYTRPAPVWTEALPVGNGHIGAMVFGGANRGTNNGDQEAARAIRDIIDGKQTRPQDEHNTLKVIVNYSNGCEPRSICWNSHRVQLPRPPRPGKARGSTSST